MTAKSAITLLHTSDWQLGKQFAQLRELHPGRLSSERFGIIGRLASLCKERNIDLLLVAGDVFDTQVLADPLIRNVVARLEAFPCPVVLMPGNHDHSGVGSIYQQVRQRIQKPDRLVLACDAEPILLLEGRLLLLPAPLNRAQSLELDFAHWHLAAETESAARAWRVGIAHGSYAGALPEAFQQHNVIPASLVESARLDYLALGDWHGMRQVASRAYYSGTPEPDGFKANESGFVLQVNLREGQLPEVVPIALARLRWLKQRLHFDQFSGLEPLEKCIKNLREPGEEWVLDLELTGELGTQQFTVLESLLLELNSLLVASKVDNQVQSVTEQDLLHVWRSKLPSGPALMVLESLLRELQQADNTDVDSSTVPLSRDLSTVPLSRDSLSAGAPAQQLQDQLTLLLELLPDYLRQAERLEIERLP